MNGRQYENLPPLILRDVKNYLQISWNDQATDARIGSLIANGMQYLDRRAGALQDYTKISDARTLLFEYVRYARDAALDVFESNYLDLIGAMREGVQTEIVESTEQT